MGVTFGKGNGNGDGHGLPPVVPEEKLIKAAMGLAKDMIETIGPEEDLQPTMFIPDMTLEPALNVVSLGMVPKSHLGEAAKATLRRFNCSWYVYVTEAWSSKRPPARGQTVSDLPLDDREEIILLLLVKNHKGIISCDSRVVDRIKATRRLGPWKVGRDFKPMSSMFPTEW